MFRNRLRNRLSGQEEASNRIPNGWNPASEVMFDVRENEANIYITYQTESRDYPGHSYNDRKKFDGYFTVQTLNNVPHRTVIRRDELGGLQTIIYATAYGNPPLFLVRVTGFPRTVDIKPIE